MNSLYCVLSMLILTATGAVPSFAESSRDLRRAVELLGDVPSANDPETLKDLGLKGQGALMGMEELGKPSPIAAQGPAAGNQSGLQGYIKSEYGGNWDPGWEREGAKTPPLPEPGDNPQPSGKEEGRWARLGAFSGGVAGAVTWLTATLLAAQYAVPLLDTTVAGLTPAAAVGRAIGMTFLLFGMFGTSIPAVLTGGKLGAGIGRWFDRKGGHKT